MKVAAAYAIAGLVSDEELTAEYILPAASPNIWNPANSPYYPPIQNNSSF